MYFIDTHSHLYQPDFAEDIQQVMERANSKHVTKILLPNIDEQSIDLVNSLTASYPNVCHPMMGLHPTYVKDNFEEVLDIILEQFNINKYIAVGEIGIDLYWDKTHIEQQRIAFRKQVNFAKENKLPFVIHARDSFDEIFEELEKMNYAKYEGIFHAFTGTTKQAERIIEMGFKLGIGGIVTFKNSGLDKQIAPIALENLVLESDAPYLTPAPYRGKRNESSYIPLVAQKLTEIYNTTMEEVASITSNNAERIFNL